MFFGLRHNQLGGLIYGIVGTVPIKNHTIDTTAHHIVDLILDLGRARGTVADVHVVRLPKPQNHVGIDLGGRARIEQRMDINFTDVPGAAIAI